VAFAFAEVSQQFRLANTPATVQDEKLCLVGCVVLFEKG